MSTEVPLEDRFDLLCDVVVKQEKQIKEQEKIIAFLVENIIDLSSKITAISDILIDHEEITLDELIHYEKIAKENFDENISEELSEDFIIGPRGNKIYKKDLESH